MQVVVDKCKAFYYTYHSLTIYRDLTMKHTILTPLTVPEDTAQELLKRLAWPSPRYLDAVIVEASFYATTPVAQTQTTPYEPSEIVFTEVTFNGFEEGELFLSLTPHESNVIDCLIGLEEELEAACWEHLESEGK